LSLVSCLTVYQQLTRTCGDQAHTNISQCQV
jgi:hypothetical protein